VKKYGRIGKGVQELTFLPSKDSGRQFSQSDLSLHFFPLEVVKTRMQVQGTQGSSKYGLHSLKSVITEEGLRGLYRGYWISAFTLPF